MGYTHSFRGINLYKAKMLSRIANVDPDLAQKLRNFKLDWYVIKNEAVEDPETGASNTDIFIYDEIGGSMGIDANQFVEDIQGIDTDTMTVRINSPGGSVYDAIAMYNALVQHPAVVKTRVDSLAASAASVIAMAADEYDPKTDTGGVEMMVGSQLMIHDVMGNEMGNAREMREFSDWLDKQSDNIASIYAAKTGTPAEEWRKMMLAETWAFAQEAVDLRLADKVYIPPKKKPAEEPPEEGDPEQDALEADKPEEDTVPASTDDEIENLINRRHRLTNRNFRYNGRNRAPAPLDIKAAVKPLIRPSNALLSDAELNDFLDMVDSNMKGNR